MAVLISLFFMVGTALGLEVDPPPPRPRVTFFNPTFVSRGFVLGNIESLRNEGSVFWRYRYEGSLFHGIGSIRGPLIDGGCEEERKLAISRTRESAGNRNRQGNESMSDACVVETNPWLFSFFDSTIFERYRSLPAGPKVLYFSVPTIAPKAIFTNTKNFIYGIWPVNNAVEIDPSRSTENLWVSGRFTQERGIVRGRVIRATVEDIVFKTYEIIVQTGNQGDSFKALSVNDPQLFDYLVDSMFAEKTMIIEFVRIVPGSGVISDFRGYWTHFRVINAEVAQ